MSKGIIYTVIRIVFGAMFFAHGLAKFQMGLGNVSGFFNSIGLPGALAYVVASLELIGGVLVIAGLFTRYISIAFTFIAAGAIMKVKMPMGLTLTGDHGIELELAYQLIAIFLTTVDPKESWGIDRLFKRSAAASN